MEILLDNYLHVLCSWLTRHFSATLELIGGGGRGDCGNWWIHKFLSAFFGFNLKCNQHNSNNITFQKTPLAAALAVVAHHAEDDVMSCNKIVCCCQADQADRNNLASMRSE